MRPPHGQTQAAGSRGTSNGSKGPWPQGPPRDTERPRMRAGGRVSPSRPMPSSFAQTASDSSLRNNGCPARTLTARRKENPSRHGRPRTPLRRGSAVPTPGARFGGRVGTRRARRQASGSRPGAEGQCLSGGGRPGRPVGVAGFAPLCPSPLTRAWWGHPSTRTVSLNHWVPRSPGRSGAPRPASPPSARSLRRRAGGSRPRSLAWRGRPSAAAGPGWACGRLGLQSAGPWPPRYPARSG